MITLRHLLRLFAINRILLRHNLDEVIFRIPHLQPARFLSWLSPWHWLPRHRKPVEVRIRLAIEDLGPIFVKFGQMLSTRKDLLSENLARELAKLQDQVPPFPEKEAQAIIEKSLGAPVASLFKNFESKALASASIAQVHAAQLHDGQKVVVKVLRPEMKRIVKRDLDLLYLLSRMAERWWPEGQRLRPVEVVAEYEKTIMGELDLMQEAANASRLRQDFENSPLLYVPKIFWRWCHEEVMVMERIHGVRISNITALKAKQVNLKKLSENGVEIFFTQVFKNNFFHADMHPGNIFVCIKDPENPKYLGVDFGIMGTLSPHDQRYLAENFLAFFNRDYRKVAVLHVASGWVPRNTSIEEFEIAIQTVCEPIFQRPLNEISFGHLLLRLFQTAQRFHMEVQPQLVLLQKTLLNIEGLGRQLYPELDLWKTAKPFLEKWVASRTGIRSLWDNLRENLPTAISLLPEMPELAREAAAEFKRYRQESEKSARNLHRELRSLKKWGFALVGLVVIAWLLTLFAIH